MAKSTPARSQSKSRAAAGYRLASRLFAGEAIAESVSTCLHLNASPEAVWNNIVLYEEVPGRPPFLLRALLPRPLRTEGEKTRTGSAVHCVYRRGELVKRIITVEPPHVLQFEVVGQSLGIEDCILTVSGSYQFRQCGRGTDVVLTTNYRAHLHPRRFWRPTEALLIRQLHRHILRGLASAVFARNPAMPSALVESLAPQCAPPGGLACTAPQSLFRR